MNLFTDFANICNPDILYVAEKDYSPVLEDVVQSRTHTHDSLELSIILSGKAHYTINDTVHTVKRGDIVLFNPGIPHSVLIPKQTHFSDLHIGVQHFLLPNGEMDYFSFPNNLPIFKLTTDSEDFFNCCTEIVKECRHCQPGHALMFKALATRLLLFIYRDLQTDTAPLLGYNASFGYPEKKRIVDFIVHYISENYMQDISLDMFAKDMYLSQVYISKIFKEETGSSPINHLIKIRLAKAKELLETTNLPIKLISGQVGYEDVYHFSKLFKKYYGASPSTFKNKKR